MKLVDETETLLNVANYLEAGLPNDAPRIGHINFNLAYGGATLFNGATACIGGLAWAWENPGASMDETNKYVSLVPEGSELAELFYPSAKTGFPPIKRYETVTHFEASTAIRRYTYGEAMFWDHVK